jgi:hypothetical protein
MHYILDSASSVEIVKIWLTHTDLKLVNFKFSKDLSFSFFNWEMYISHLGQ